ncbi:acyltransferase [Thiothrix litoralis]|uniref:Acyltransferase n=1 Tax=Thiothrix litoralis TaxID=2891210 RepID=A0ABX7WRA6_9GAMM|nr:acyltransferase family protein [Thiothrix litoralis]QTR46419.1 acyltransferase [Thiothrix litoralis]
MLKDNIIKFPKENNLELLRLIFALQVVISHMSSHMEFPIPSFISYFPGVPAFFFVSGLLIYTSYLNAPGKKYITNRFLRLFPGLLIVTAGGILLILFAKGYPFIRENLPIIITWSFSQITIGQAFNPSIFRDIGVGVINGSLWTITVEIIFYLVVPIIVLF